MVVGAGDAAAATAARDTSNAIASAAGAATFSPATHGETLGFSRTYAL
jgi:hypothetical protein